LTTENQTAILFVEVEVTALDADSIEEKSFNAYDYEEVVLSELSPNYVECYHYYIVRLLVGVVAKIRAKVALWRLDALVSATRVVVVLSTRNDKNENCRSQENTLGQGENPDDLESIIIDGFTELLSDFCEKRCGLRGYCDFKKLSSSIDSINFEIEFQNLITDHRKTK